MSTICKTFSQIASPRACVRSRVINLSQQSKRFAYLEIIHVLDQLICVECLTRWAQIIIMIMIKITNMIMTVIKIMIMIMSMTMIMIMIMIMTLGPQPPALSPHPSSLRFEPSGPRPQCSGLRRQASCL